jgi:hypothetical protein
MQNRPILDAIDPEIVDTLVSRRDAIARGARVSGSVAAALALGSAPITLATLAGTAYAQAPADIVNVLQFALLLESLEAEFYNAVLGESSVPAFNTAFATVRTTLSTTERASLVLIRDHERAHVTVLTSAIIALGGTAITYAPAATFDFTGARSATGGGPFAAAGTDKAFLLLVAQAFEDTGVRAYKGQAPNLMSNNGVLQTALQIHSIEARHASRIRRMRRLTSGGTLPPSDAVRLSGVVRGGGSNAAGATGSPPAQLSAAAALIYAGEELTTQTANAGGSDVSVNLTTLPNLPAGTTVAALAQAFDEPLTRAQVVAIVQPFVIPTIS